MRRRVIEKAEPPAASIWCFIFSYYGFVTAVFVVIWIVEIRKHLNWWEYVCIALINCFAYIRSRDDWNFPVKLYLTIHIVVGGAIAIGLYALLMYSLLKWLFHWR